MALGLKKISFKQVLVKSQAWQCFSVILALKEEAGHAYIYLFIMHINKYHICPCILFINTYALIYDLYIYAYVCIYVYIQTSIDNEIGGISCNSDWH